MKYLIASDIHGSITYANKVIEAFEIHQCDEMLLLGDFLYHGPRNDLPEGYAPKQVIPLLNRYRDKIIAVRGNCDAEVDQMVLDFSIMSDYKLIHETGYDLYLSHGHIYAPDKLPVGIKSNDLFIYGHIHVPKHEYHDGIYIINPGSISIPKENSLHSYAVLNGDTVCFYDDQHEKYFTYDLKK